MKKTLEYLFLTITPVQDPLTYFPQFNGALKLLAGNYEEDGQVDPGVKSWLQLKTLSVPAGGSDTHITNVNNYMILIARGKHYQDLF